MTAATPALNQYIGTPDGLGVAVVYQPTRQVAGPLMFMAPLERQGKRKENADQVELTQFLMTEGTQFVEADRWERVYNHPSNKAVIDRGIKRRTFTVVQPEPQEDGTFTGTTADFSDEDDALFLIANSYSLEWLRGSSTQDKRTAIKKAALDRIERVKKMAAEKKIPMAALGGS